MKDLSKFEKVYSTSDYRRKFVKEYKVPEDFYAVFGSVRNNTQRNIKQGHRFLSKVNNCSFVGAKSMKNFEPSY
jgi:hypothetical protein